MPGSAAAPPSLRRESGSVAFADVRFAITVNPCQSHRMQATVEASFPFACHVRAQVLHCYPRPRVVSLSHRWSHLCTYKVESPVGSSLRFVVLVLFGLLCVVCCFHFHRKIQADLCTFCTHGGSTRARHSNQAMNSVSNFDLAPSLSSGFLQ